MHWSDWIFQEYHNYGILDIIDDDDHRDTTTDTFPPTVLL